jgi:formylglycine-generating enzyme required for sulfatase activity
MNYIGTEPRIVSSRRLENKGLLGLFITGGLILLLALPPHAVRAEVVQGEVVSVEGAYIRIDKGAESGLKVGDQGKVYYMVFIGAEGKPRPVSVASFTVTGVEFTTSLAKVDTVQGRIKVGYLVETTTTAPPKPGIVREPPLVVEQPAQQEPSAKASKKRQKRQAKAGDIWRDPHLGMSFVWVPPGCFEMGCGEWLRGCSDSERPPHKVCVSGFWMARHEVTQQQWRLLMGTNPAGFNRCGLQCPVEKVSWVEAVEFARKLSAKTRYLFRLPTEAEWEYACRSGGRQQSYSGGDAADAVAWYKENADGSPHPVGKKRPNDLGIYDMTGNVWEWCLDSFDKDAYLKVLRSLENPVFVHDRFSDIYKEGYTRIVRLLAGASGYRSVRGGSWGNGVDRLRSTDRIKGDPTSGRDWLGFRLVREATKKK